MKKFIAIFAMALLAVSIMPMASATEQTEPLCYKGASTGWACGDNPDPAYSNAAGTLTYEDLGAELQMTLDLTDLKPNFDYQITLNGRCGGDGNAEIEANSPKPNSPATWYGFNVAWESGSWPKTCDATQCREGFWNFDMTATTDSNGDLQKSYHLNLPIGHYGPAGAGCSPEPCCNWPLGFIVKEGGDSGPWTPVLMDTNGIEFTIVGTSEKMVRIVDDIEFLKEDDEAKWEAISMIKEAVCSLFHHLGIPNPFWTCPGIVECTYDSDCGTNGPIGDPYCVGDDVIQDYIAYTCNNPGATSSYCSDATTPTFVETCEHGCTAGVCNEAPPTEDCTTKEDYKYCGWGKWLYKKDYYTCQYGHGTDTECEPGFCKYMTKYVSYCRSGCTDNGDGNAHCN